MLSITLLDFLLTNLFLTKTIVDKNAYQFWVEIKARYYDMTCRTFLKIYIVPNKDEYLFIDLEFELQVMTAAFQTIRVKLIFIRVIC